MLPRVRELTMTPTAWNLAIKSGCANMWLPPQPHRVWAVGEGVRSGDERLREMIGRLKRSRLPDVSLASLSETSIAASAFQLFCLSWAGPAPAPPQRNPPLPVPHLRYPCLLPERSRLRSYAPSFPSHLCLAVSGVRLACGRLSSRRASSVCNHITIILLHASRRPMAAAPLLHKRQR